MLQALPPDPVPATGVTDPQPAATTSTPQAASPRARRWALVAMGAGVVGAIVALVLIGVVWFGRGWATDKVDGVSASVVQTLEGGKNIVDTVTGRLDDVSANLAALSAAAAVVADNPTPTAAAEDTLRGKLQDIGARYDQLRAGYVDLRGKIQGALDGLDAISRLVSKLEPVSQTLDEAFTALDTRITTLDSAIQDVRASIQNAATLPATARSIVSGKLSSAVSDASAAIGQVSTRIADAQQRVSQLSDDVAGYITIAAVVVTVVLLWLFLVHLGLFAFARRVRNG